MSTAPPPPDHRPTQPYQGYPGGYPMPRPTNTFAVVALVGAFLFSPLGIVFGHLALSQIKRTGEDGRGLAIAALVIGYVATGFLVIMVLMWLAGMATLIGLFGVATQQMSTLPTGTVSP